MYNLLHNHQLIEDGLYLVEVENIFSHLKTFLFFVTVAILDEGRPIRYDFKRELPNDHHCKIWLNLGE